jgi:hypothetical protein
MTDAEMEALGRELASTIRYEDYQHTVKRGYAVSGAVAGEKEEAPLVVRRIDGCNSRYVCDIMVACLSAAGATGVMATADDRNDTARIVAETPAGRMIIDVRRSG